MTELLIFWLLLGLLYNIKFFFFDERFPIRNAATHGLFIMSMVMTIICVAPLFIIRDIYNLIFK